MYILLLFFRLTARMLLSRPSQIYCILANTDMNLTWDLRECLQNLVLVLVFGEHAEENGGGSLAKHDGGRRRMKCKEATAVFFV